MAPDNKQSTQASIPRHEPLPPLRPPQPERVDFSRCPLALRYPRDQFYGKFKRHTSTAR